MAARRRFGFARRSHRVRQARRKVAAAERRVRFLRCLLAEERGQGDRERTALLQLFVAVGILRVLATRVCRCLWGQQFDDALREDYDKLGISPDQPRPHKQRCSGDRGAPAGPAPTDCLLRGLPLAAAATVMELLVWQDRGRLRTVATWGKLWVGSAFELSRLASPLSGPDLAEVGLKASRH